MERLARGSVFSAVGIVVFLAGCASGTGAVAGASLRCRPVTCAALGMRCSVFPDGCGGTVDCGSCDERRYAELTESPPP